MVAEQPKESHRDIAESHRGVTEESLRADATKVQKAWSAAGYDKVLELFGKSPIFERVCSPVHPKSHQSPPKSPQSHRGSATSHRGVPKSHLGVTPRIRVTFGDPIHSSHHSVGALGDRALGSPKESSKESPKESPTNHQVFTEEPLWSPVRITTAPP